MLFRSNDGELSFKLTHPKFGVDKKYHVKVRGFVTDEEARRLEKGVDLEEGPSAPCVVTVDERTKRESRLTVVMHEGKKRQVRRIFEKVGHRVLELERFQYGPLTLGDLRPGQKRRLTALLEGGQVLGAGGRGQQPDGEDHPEERLHGCASLATRDPTS